MIASDRGAAFDRSFRRFLAPGILSAPLWIAGGLAFGDARVVLWIVALTLDYAAPLLRY